MGVVHTFLVHSGVCLLYVLRARIPVKTLESRKHSERVKSKALGSFFVDFSRIAALSKAQ